MSDNHAMIPVGPDRWRVRCPACRTLFALPQPANPRPHLKFRCCKCSTEFWAVRWWMRVEAINRWREAPGRPTEDQDLAVLAMLSCAADHLRALPPGGNDFQIRLFERAFEARDTAHGLARLRAFAQDLPLAAPAPTPAPAPAAPQAPAQPSSCTPTAEDLALVMPTDGRVHTRCPNCWESTTVTASEAAAGEGIARCDCGHRWVWSPKRELAGIFERMETMLGMMIPFAIKLLRSRLGPAEVPVSRLTRSFAESATSSTDLESINRALQILSIERGIAE